MTRIAILNKVDYSLSTTNYMSDMINTLCVFINLVLISGFYLISNPTSEL